MNSVKLKSREADENDSENSNNKNIENSSYSLKNDYFYTIKNLETEIIQNKSALEKSKVKLKEIKKQFYFILSKMKEENFSNIKILIDLIELEFKQNSLNINNYNKLNKLIDNLK